MIDLRKFVIRRTLKYENPKEGQNKLVRESLKRVRKVSLNKYGRASRVAVISFIELVHMLNCYRLCKDVFKNHFKI